MLALINRRTRKKVYLLGENHLYGPTEGIPDVQVVFLEYDAFYKPARSECFPSHDGHVSQFLNKIDSQFSKSFIQPSRLPPNAVLCDVREACHNLKSFGLRDLLSKYEWADVRNDICFRASKLIHPPFHVVHAFDSLHKGLAGEEEKAFSQLMSTYRDEVSRLFRHALDDDLANSTFKTRGFLVLENNLSLEESMFSDAPCKLTDLFFILNILSTSHLTCGVVCGCYHIDSIRRLLSRFGYK
jgi:hypothetical protein